MQLRKGRVSSDWYSWPEHYTSTLVSCCCCRLSDSVKEATIPVEDSSIKNVHFEYAAKVLFTCGKLGPLKLQRCPSKGYDAMLAVSCDDCVDDTFQTVVTRSGHSPRWFQQRAKNCDECLEMRTKDIKSRRRICTNTVMLLFVSFKKYARRISTDSFRSYPQICIE